MNTMPVEPRPKQHNASSLRTRALAVAVILFLLGIPVTALLATTVEGSNATHSLMLIESAGGESCSGAGSSCSINLIGSSTPGAPGEMSTRSVVLRNAGNVPAILSLQTLGCTAVPDSNEGSRAGSDRAGFCDKLDITIEAGGRCFIPLSTHSCPLPSSQTTLASTGSTLVNMGTLDGGSSMVVTVRIKFDPKATNADQGLEALEPMHWTLTA